MSGSDLNGALACISDAQGKIEHIRNEITELLEMASEMPLDDYKQVVIDRVTYLIEILDNVA